MSDIMKIAYIYKRHALDAEGLGAEKLFADDEKTDRIGRSAMIDGEGVRRGDTLMLRALSDLGKPKEAARLQQMIEAMGVTIEVMPLPTPPKPVRKVWLSPTAKQKQKLCVLWYSSIPPNAALNGAEHVMGRKVSRAQMNRLCGKRDGSSKKI